ncbi:MAG: NAD(P)H-hydrate dehydratase, partial [Acidimicrobiia bacterium]
VLVVGGAPGMVGATVLAGRGALRFGAGAVAVACPKTLQMAVAGPAPELLSYGLGEGEHFTSDLVTETLEVAERFDVLVVGSGIGRGQEVFVRGVAERWPGRLLLDADGINAVDIDTLRSRSGPTVLTPHAGEFRRLAGSEPDYRAAVRLAEACGATVLLKGNPTIVTDRVPWVITSGGPELATIGTGDVLTGMVAALWARGLDPVAAARSGAHWHGRAGAYLKGAVTADRLVAAVGQWAFPPFDGGPGPREGQRRGVEAGWSDGAPTPSSSQEGQRRGVEAG